MCLDQHLLACKPSSKIFLLTVPRRYFLLWIICFIILQRSLRDIVLASSVRPSVCPSVNSVRPSDHTFCLSGTTSQYLLVKFDSFLVQMISTMDSRYHISLVKIDPLTLELLPLFWYRQLHTVQPAALMTGY